ncbi:MAG: alpha/beta fold hydrolase, partial [Alphaproteobacteria bacterium]
MADAKVTRRLAAILAADVVGYSKMMGADEAGTLAALRDICQAEFDPCIGRHNGRIAKKMGDGALAEFASVVDAVSCAVAFQRAMAARNSAQNSAQNNGDAAPIEFRIGVNLGDIWIEDGDIFGDGVNIAARLEGLAPAGGVLTSDSVHGQVVGKVDVDFADMGEQSLKNIDRPVHYWQWDGKADRAAGTVTEASLEQKIHFCTSSDSAEIAYATSGTGPPLVRAPHWMSHLEFDWQSPIWRHVLASLSQEHTLVRFDQRPNGLSDWGVEDVSFEAFISDLEAVVDAARLERFPLFGISQGCAISIAYAMRHPERVSRFVLYGGFARSGEKRGSAAADQAVAMRTLIKTGWGRDNPAFRQMFTSSFLPGGTAEQWDWFNELQRVSV